MTEDEFANAIADLGRMFDWKIAGFRPARTSKGWRTAVRFDGKGFPDLTLVHAERRCIIFAELKTDTGRLSDEQKEWGATLTACANRDVYSGPPFSSDGTGVQYAVWRPRDADEIATLLSFGRVTEWNITPTTKGTR